MEGSDHISISARGNVSVRYPRLSEAGRLQAFGPLTLGPKQTTDYAAALLMDLTSP